MLPQNKDFELKEAPNFSRYLREKAQGLLSFELGTIDRTTRIIREDGKYLGVYTCRKFPHHAQIYEGDMPQYNSSRAPSKLRLEYSSQNGKPPVRHDSHEEIPFP